MIKHAYRNLLEDGVVTLSAGAAASGFPLYRLYDRNIGKLFKGSSAVTTTVKVDTGYNLVDLAVNGGFEVGSYSPGWTPGVNAISGLNVRTGSYCSKYLNAGLNSWANGVVSDPYSINVALITYVEFYCNALNLTGVNAQYHVELREYDGYGALLATTIVFSATAPTGGYTQGVKSFGPAGTGADVEYNAATVHVKLHERGYVASVPVEVYLDDVTIKQPSGIRVDRLLIPAGHNLAGIAVAVTWSNDDATYVTAFSGTVAAGLIDLSWAPVAARYWKISFTSPASPVEIPELILTSTYEHPRNPARPSGPHDLTPTMEVVQLAGGQIRTVRLGEPRRRRMYRLEGVSSAHKAELEALEASWADGKPVWLYDHEGVWIYVQLTGPIRLIEQSYGRHSAVLECLEVLP